jgi:hypothetical protein
MNIVEHIASLADIDTRRAMGFPPRKLAIPYLNFGLSSDQGTWRLVKLRGAHLYLCPNEITWVFGTDDFRTCRTYCFRRDGRVSHYALLVMKHSHHPDLNEDGTLRCWKT